MPFLNHLLLRQDVFMLAIRLAAVSLIALYLFQTTKASIADGNALRNFMTSADLQGNLRKLWINDDPCENAWKGVQCLNGTVSDLVLDSSNLTGSIPENSLGALTQLRKLSLKANRLTGRIPADLKNCIQLKHLYLLNNQFTGPIPGNLSGRLRRIDLSNNTLTGVIPSSIAEISRLITFRVQSNELTGTIPSFNQTSLTDFNVSYNRLSGSIPTGVARFSIYSFMENAQLCDQPLAACAKAPTSSAAVGSPQPSSAGTPAKRTLKTGHIVGIVLADAGFLLFLTFGFLYHYKKRYAGGSSNAKAVAKVNHANDDGQKQFASTSMSLAEEDKPKLVFFDNRRTFRLEDLLRASAEMIGKGSLGTTYKALMEDGRAVAVKRLKDLNNIGQKEFEQQMQLVGKLAHANVVPLWAYYYAKEEKLLVYEYQPNGNLLTLLHGPLVGSSRRARKPLAWNARLRVARGVANGLAFLHHECESQKIPHGNLRSSNILIDKNFEACIADFGLGPLLNPVTSAYRMNGYKAPEYDATKKVTHKADVYSFGVLLLELLTGRMADYGDSNESPNTFNLPQWVNSVVREEWTAEVFDHSLIATNPSEESLVTTLQLAMACVSQRPEQRPRMNQVLKMITEIKEDEISTSYGTSMSTEHAQIGERPDFTSSDESPIMRSSNHPVYDEHNFMGF